MDLREEPAEEGELFGEIREGGFVGGAMESKVVAAEYLFGGGGAD